MHQPLRSGGRSLKQAWEKALERRPAARVINFHDFDQTGGIDQFFRSQISGIALMALVSRRANQVSWLGTMPAFHPLRTFAREPVRHQSFNSRGKSRFSPFGVDLSRWTLRRTPSCVTPRLLCSRGYLSAPRALSTQTGHWSDLRPLVDRLRYTTGNSGLNPIASRSAVPIPNQGEIS